MANAVDAHVETPSAEKEAGPMYSRESLLHFQHATPSTSAASDASEPSDPESESPSSTARKVFLPPPRTMTGMNAAAATAGGQVQPKGARGRAFTDSAVSSSIKSAPAPAPAPAKLATSTAPESAAGPQTQTSTKLLAQENMDGPTTAMLRNIPTKYTRTGLCELLEIKGLGYAIDFLYLPIDRTTDRNMGYAFVNLRTQDACRKFFEAFHNTPATYCLPGFNSTKVCEVTFAAIQGRDANMEKLCSASNLAQWAGRPQWQPLFLNDDGSRIPLPSVSGRSGKKTATGRDRLGSGSSPNLAPQKSPNLGPKKSPKSPPTSPPLNAQATEFEPTSVLNLTLSALLSPNLHAGAEPEYLLPMSSLELTLSALSPLTACSPNLRAEAPEFVPFAAPMLPEAALDAEPEFDLVDDAPVKTSEK